jgi:hypothetical protein
MRWDYSDNVLSGETTSARKRATNGPSVHPPDDIWVNTDQRFSNTVLGKTEEVGEKPVPSPPSPTNPT